MEIIQMPDTLANKIAAGEVVERPASVVKELIENSIDANSTWIKVEVSEAGLDQIKITDNGDGMAVDDCERAFLRHATSKIRDEYDLFRVKTLGFRGEALASIASVSRLTVQTSKGSEAGTYLKLEGGNIIEKKKSDARKGTEITVSNLFFNTPARLKYMKTIHTELGHITDLLNRLALSHPAIRFEVKHNGKLLFKTTGTGDILQVIAQVYGMGVAKKMIPIEQETLDFNVKGYIARPEVTRASRNYISIMINGRYIKNIALSQAIIRGYHTLLPIGRSPIVVLSIQMDPILVDVNVHPAKLEVRFSKERELCDLVEETIKSTFRKNTLIPEMEKQPKMKANENAYQQTFDLSNNKPNRYEELQHQATSKTDISHGSNISGRETNVSYGEKTMEPEVVTQDNRTDVMVASTTPEETVSGNDSSTSIINQADRIPVMYPIGQLHGTYILAQNENGLYMVDQHAAQERIKYEFFKKKLSEPINLSQELLIPLTFEFSQQESIFIKHGKEKLEEVGLFFEPFGQQTYIIRSYPKWFPKGFEEEIIREMIDHIMQNERIDVERIREDAAILMSCKRSIKANHYLNTDDMQQLLEDLRKTTDPFTCPHGRPIIVHFSSYELEKMFKRVM